MALVDGGDLFVRAIIQEGVDTIGAHSPPGPVPIARTAEFRISKNIVILNSVFTKRTPRFAQRTHRFAQKEAHSWPW